MSYDVMPRIGEAPESTRIPRFGSAGRGASPELWLALQPLYDLLRATACSRAARGRAELGRRVRLAKVRSRRKQGRAAPI